MEMETKQSKSGRNTIYQSGDYLWTPWRSCSDADHHAGARPDGPQSINNWGTEIYRMKKPKARGQIVIFRITGTGEVSRESIE